MQKRQSAASSSRVSVAETVGGAVRVALIGGVALALVESAAVVSVSAEHFPKGWWPTGLILAGFGRATLTHIIVWFPLLLVGAAFHRPLRRRGLSLSADPLAWGVFVLIAGCVVAPADLELAGRATTPLVVSACVGTLVVAAATYAAASVLTRRLEPTRVRRIINVAACLAVLVTGVSTIVFVRSPLFDQGNYVVPEGSRVQGAERRPNVLWVVLDTARADHLSCYGHSRQTTPFLDRWAEQSIVFDRAVSNGIWTVPAHASMFTGLSVRAHGTDHRHLWLDEPLRTVADVLGAAGYATAMFSNNPLVSPDTNLAKGFQTCLVVCHFSRLSRFSLGFLCERWGITPFLPWLDQDSGAALTNDLVADWLDGHADTPKFVFINYMEAHLPYRVPRRYRRMFLNAGQVDRSYDLRRRVHGNLVSRLDLDYNIHGSDFLSASDCELLQRQYEATLRYLDDRVREVIDMFKQRGLLDNTLVVISSDHGEHLGTHGMWAHRFLAYQDLAHVVLQIREPGRRSGVRVSTPVQLSDLYATVLNAALSQPNGKRFPDVPDLLAIAERGGERRVAICEYSGPAPVTMKRFRNRTDPVVLHRTTPQIAAVDQRFKLIQSADGRRELYDLLQDPGELHNLIDELPREVVRLEAHIRDWLEATPAYTPLSQADESPSPEVLRALRSLGYVGDD